MPPLYRQAPPLLWLQDREDFPWHLELIQLPDELLLIVIEFLSPTDLENFTLSCKRIFNCAIGYLEKHRVLKRRYLEAIITDDQTDRPYYHCTHPIFLLERIYLEPAVAHYVKTLEFRGVDAVTPQPRKDALQPSVQNAIRKCDGAVSVVKAAAASYPDDEHRQTVSAAVRKGDRSAVFCLLLACMPHLAAIRFIDFQWTEHQHVTDLSRVMSTLPHISTVELHGDEAEENPADVLDLAAFSLVPTVRHLKGRYIYTDWNGVFVGGWSEHVSNVEVLELTVAQVSSDALQAILGRMNKLRVFRYSAVEIAELIAYDVPAFNTGIDEDHFELVLEALSDRLERLSILNSSWSLARISTLKRFKVCCLLDLLLSAPRSCAYLSRTRVSLAKIHTDSHNRCSRSWKSMCSR